MDRKIYLLRSTNYELYREIRDGGLKKLYEKLGDKLEIEDLKYIKENYVQKSSMEGYKTRVKNLTRENNEYKNNNKKIIEDELNQRLELIKSCIKSACDTKIQELNDEVVELQKKLETWKAMYTGQCEANRKLIDQFAKIHGEFKDE